MSRLADQRLRGGAKPRFQAIDKFDIWHSGNPEVVRGGYNDNPEFAEVPNSGVTEGGAWGESPLLTLVAVLLCRLNQLSVYQTVTRP